MTAIDPRANGLDPATMRTLTRIMQEGATNILRYSAALATCHCTITTDLAWVSLTITSPLAARVPRSKVSLGWGLRGIRERVDLTHGTFGAGPIGDSWVIDVTLPVSPGPAIAPPLNALGTPETEIAPTPVG